MIANYSNKQIMKNKEASHFVKTISDKTNTQTEFETTHFIHLLYNNVRIKGKCLKITFGIIIDFLAIKTKTGTTITRNGTD